MGPAESSVCLFGSTVSVVYPARSIDPGALASAVRRSTIPCKQMARGIDGRPVRTVPSGSILVTPVVGSVRWRGAIKPGSSGR